MKKNNQRVRDIIYGNSTIQKIFDSHISNYKHNKFSRNYSCEKDDILNKTNTNLSISPYKGLFTTQNVLNGKCNSKEKPKIPF